MRAPLLILLALPLVACSGRSTDDDDGPVPVRDAGPAARDGGPQAAVVYYRDVKPIIDARCNICHTGAGALAPIDLSVPAVVQSASALVRSQVEQKLMPPWHANNECQSYLENRALSQDEHDTILEWVDLGAHMGDPADEGAPLERNTRGLTRVDLRTTVEEAYEPSGSDDYRCFIFDWPQTDVSFVTGFNLEPSNASVVHHANVYQVSAQDVPTFRARDDAAAGAGWPCFGGIFSAGTALMGAWAPGSLGIEYPAGTGLQVDPGNAIVLEMHYNTGVDRNGPDQSTIAWQLEDNVDRRALIAPFWNFQQWSSGNMPIPAGEADVMHRVDFNPEGFVPLLAPWLISNEIQIWAAGLHMHWLGTQGSIHINRQAPAADECVLEIPRWDFNWQYGYLLEQPIDFTIGQDTLMLECHWDNTAENQPVVDGVRRPPRNVNWGEDSDDEMCIGYIYVTER